MISAVFRLDLSEGGVRPISAAQKLMALQTQGLLFHWRIEGPARSQASAKLKVAGSDDAIQAVGVLFDAQPAVIAAEICDWCLERRATTQLSDFVDSGAENQIRADAAICAVCLAEGRSDSLLRKRRMAMGVRSQ